MKTVLITGANRGIGLKFVQQYAADGDQVIACCRNPSKAAELNGLARHGQVQVLELDVCDGASIDQLREHLSTTSIDILINNAGVYGKRLTLGQLDYGIWMQVLQTNTLGPIRVTEALLGPLTQGNASKLVYITSKMGSIADNGSGGAYIYRTSKAALNAAVKSISLDLASHGAIAVAIHPGWVQTDMGGANALIDTQTSVTNMRRVIEGLKTSDNGRFLNYDGKEIPW